MKSTPAHKTLWQGLCLALPLIPTQTVTEWAEANRIMSRGVTDAAGKFTALPMQRAAMDDLTNPDVSEIVLCWAAQTGGKSEVINNCVGFLMAADPSSILLVQPTDKLVADYSKERIAPMLRDTPALAQIVRSPRSRDSGNTVLSKVFPGGSLAMVGANSPAGLAGRPRRAILQDEIDRYPASAGTEGDPCALADKRADSFPNAIKLKTSTPTVKGQSRIWNLLEQSDFQKWHCRCPRCDFEQVLLWENVKWPEDMPQDAWLQCASPACAAHLTDAERVAMVRNGRWKGTQIFRSIRGRWLNGINTLFRKHRGFKNRLHEMAADFIKAKAGGRQSMRVWVNTFLCETFEEETESAAKPDELLLRAEDYAPDCLPNDVLVLTAGVDVQNNRLECVVIAAGRDQETWGVEKVVFDGDPEGDEVWQNLDGYLLRTFTREDRVPLKIERAFCDMQFKSQRVLAFCAPRLARGVYPCRGINREGPRVPPLLPAQPSRNNRARIPHWNIGVTVAKTTIFDRLPLPTPGPRSMHFPAGCGFDADYFRQLTSEKRKTRYTHGVAYFIFEKDNSAVRNEALDLNVYAMAALESIGPIGWQKRGEFLKTLAPPKADQPADPNLPPGVPDDKPAPAKLAPKAPRRNFATGW